MSFSHRWLKIPVFMTGIFCMCMAACAHDLLLQLFSDEQWDNAQREARRILIGYPDDPVAENLLLLARLKTGTQTTADIERLSHLSKQAGDPERRAVTSLALAHYYAGIQDIEHAVDSLSDTLIATHNPDLFHIACATLDALKWSHPTAKKRITPELQFILDTSRPQWTAVMRQEAATIRPDTTSPSVYSLPGQVIVSFYRTQISPALGRRCSLHPSCSEFFKQASEAYGLRGVPMLGDRLVREPGIVSEGNHPVAVGPHILYADPIRKQTH